MTASLGNRKPPANIHLTIWNLIPTTFVLVLQLPNQLQRGHARYEVGYPSRNRCPRLLIEREIRASPTNNKRGRPQQPQFRNACHAARFVTLVIIMK